MINLGEVKVGSHTQQKSHSLFRAVWKTALNNVLLSTLFNVVNNMGRGFIGYPKGRNRDIKLVN